MDWHYGCGTDLAEVFNHPYHELYLDDIIDLQADAFYMIRDYLPGVDEKWFITEFMKSKTRAALDKGNFMLANKMPDEIIDDFLKEKSGDYKKGASWWGMLPVWVGMIYSLFQWICNVPSAKLIDVLTLDIMERYYVPLHQVGEDVAVERLYEDFRDKIDKIKN